MSLIKIGICFLFILLALSCKKKLEEEESIHSGGEVKTEWSDSLSKTEIEFDKSKWMAKDDHHYIYRDIMLTIIIDNQLLDSLNENEILDLLGEPDRIDNNHLFYMIAQKRLGLWPLHTKTMVIKLKDDGELEWMRIHE